MTQKQGSSIRNPLQLLGGFLAILEIAGAASLFATTSVEHWTRHFIMFVMGLGILIYVGIAGYVLVVLVRKHPHLLFNPSDYDSGVQPLLFGPDRELHVDLPPEE